MIDKIQQHFGFAQMPFGRDLTPAALHRHAAHGAELQAQINYAALIGPAGADQEKGDSRG